MTLTLTDVLIVVALCSCVPIQHILVQNWGNTEANRSYALNKFVNRYISFRDSYLSWESWEKYLLRQWNLQEVFPTIPAGADPDEGESLAIEVMRYKHKHRYFSFSPEARSVRPPTVRLRVGQVVRHRRWRYRGVIVGWDEIAKAPPEWLDEMHGHQHMEWREMPNYSILVDTRDRLSPQLTYVPQDNIEVVNETRVIHPFLEDHFEGYQEDKYIPRPWLQNVYPQD